MGGQVGKETRSANFGVDPSIRGVFREDMPIFQLSFFFTALYGMQMRSSSEKAVRLSVRLSVRQTRELWQNGRKICPNFYTIQKII